MENRNRVIEIELFWSPDDQEYVVTLARQHGVSALGKTIKKALRSFADLLPAIVEISGVEAIGRPEIPTTTTRCIHGTPSVDRCDRCGW